MSNIIYNVSPEIVGRFVEDFRTPLPDQGAITLDAAHEVDFQKSSELLQATFEIIESGHRSEIDRSQNIGFNLISCGVLPFTGTALSSILANRAILSYESGDTIRILTDAIPLIGSFLLGGYKLFPRPKPSKVGMQKFNLLADIAVEVGVFVEPVIQPNGDRLIVVGYPSEQSTDASQTVRNRANQLVDTYNQSTPDKKIRQIDFLRREAPDPEIANIRQFGTPYYFPGYNRYQYETRKVLSAESAYPIEKGREIKINIDFIELFCATFQNHQLTHRAQLIRHDLAGQNIPEDQKTEIYRRRVAQAARQYLEQDFRDPAQETLHTPEGVVVNNYPNSTYILGEQFVEHDRQNVIVHSPGRDIESLIAYLSKSDIFMDLVAGAQTNLEGIGRHINAFLGPKAEIALCFAIAKGRILDIEQRIKEKLPGSVANLRPGSAPVMSLGMIRSFPDHDELIDSMPFNVTVRKKLMHTRIPISILATIGGAFISENQEDFSMHFLELPVNGYEYAQDWLFGAQDPPKSHGPNGGQVDNSGNPVGLTSLSQNNGASDKSPVWTITQNSQTAYDVEGYWAISTKDRILTNTQGAVVDSAINIGTSQIDQLKHFYQNTETDETFSYYTNDLEMVGIATDKIDGPGNIILTSAYQIITEIDYGKIDRSEQPTDARVFIPFPLKNGLEPVAAKSVIATKDGQQVAVQSADFVNSIYGNAIVLHIDTTNLPKNLQKITLGSLEIQLRETGIVSKIKATEKSDWAVPPTAIIAENFAQNSELVVNDTAPTPPIINDHKLYYEDVNYSLSPAAVEDFNHDNSLDFKDLRISVAQSGVADCDTGNILVASSSHGQVIPVGGFLNNGDGLLGHNEAHMWNVDKLGIEQDSTPYGLAAKEGYGGFTIATSGLIGALVTVAAAKKIAKRRKKKIREEYFETISPSNQEMAEIHAYVVDSLTRRDDSGNIIYPSANVKIPGDYSKADAIQLMNLGRAKISRILAEEKKQNKNYKLSKQARKQLRKIPRKKGLNS